jgi:hypothetical protein
METLGTWLLAAAGAAILAAGCGGSGGAGDGGAGDASDAAGDAAADTPADTPEDAPVDTGPGDGTDEPPPPAGCGPLPDPTGPTVTVGPDGAGELRGIVAGAAEGTTILLEDGTYDMSGGDGSHRLVFATPGVTLRSASGDREAVVLDGGYVTGELVSISASDVTIADLTLERAYYHPVHVTGGAASDIEGVLLYDLHIIDPGQQAVKINASTENHYADGGRVECSLIELTEAGRPEIRDSCYTGGIDAHLAWGWEVRLNTIRGFWCTTGLSEHGIHFWRSSRDTLVERNLIVDCARGIGFGLGDSGPTDRAYDPDPYPGVGYIGHVDGTIRNNMIFASIPGFDSGITLDQARGTVVVHNTVFTTVTPFSSIEYRFPNTLVEILNNLVSHVIMERDGATATLTGNVTGAEGSWFVDATAPDLHLETTATGAVDQGASLPAGTCDDDYDGEARDTAPDVGADEVVD